VITCKFIMKKSHLAAHSRGKEALLDDDYFRNREGKLVQSDFEANDVLILTTLITKASRNAIAGIANMVGRDIEVNTANLRQMPAKNVGAMLKNPENILVGIDLEIQGDATGHMLLIYPPQVAYGLVDLLIGNPLGQTTSLEEMEQSAIAEMGNIAGGFFLNSLSDDTGLRLLPSPPTVKVDKAAAILDGTLKPLISNESTIFVLQTIFRAQDQQITGNFLVLPTPGLLTALIKYGAHITPSAVSN